MNNTLKLNIDYYLDESGLMIFTEAYHLKRGTCCGSNCRHCPFEKKDPNIPQEFSTSWSSEYSDEDDDEYNY